MSSRRVDALVGTGQWRVLHRGVMVASDLPVTPKCLLLAAVAAGGEASTASHLSAAWLLGLLDKAPATPWVTLPATRRRRLEDVMVHRARPVEGAPPERTHLDGIPTTTVHRTLVDCAAAAPTVLTGLVDRALARQLLDVPRLVAYLDGPRARRPGVTALREHLGQRGLSGEPAPSVLESAFDRLVDRAGLPRPVHEHRVVVDGRERYLDRAFPELLLAWEVDGYAYHSSPERATDDHRRRNGLARLGWTVLVFTWMDVMQRPDSVVRDLADSYRRSVAAREGALH